MEMSSPGSGRGGRRRFAADLNLVPYIDLLTCMIAFLLITAVWTQLARIETAQRSPGADHSGDAPAIQIVVMVDEAGFNLMVDQDREVLPKTGRGHDFPALAAALAKLKARYPDKNDALVTSEDAITFDVLVATMDSLLAAGFPSVSLADPVSSGP